MPHSSDRQRVAVIGLGGIGGVAAGALALAGRHNVIACARRPIERLTVDLPDESAVVSLDVLTDPGDASPVDWVLLTTKAQDTDGAGAWLRALCGPGTTVAVLQNGIDHAARVAPYVGEAEVLPTIVYYNGERIAADHVRMRHVGTADISLPDSAAAGRFADLLAGTPIGCQRNPDFVTEAWRKLLINIVANPITALTRQRQAVLRRDDAKALAATLLEEGVAVARASGAQVGEDDAELIMARLMKFPPEAGTSMYFDVMAGRPLEGDALTGAVVDAGARLGIPTPANSILLTLLRGLSDGMR